MADGVLCPRKRAQAVAHRLLLRRSSLYKSDAVRGLSSHLVRGRPGNRSMVAVGGDARPETAINALLDLLAWRWQLTVDAQKPADAADLLVGDGPNASQILDALRTLVATHAGLATHLSASCGEGRRDVAEPGS